MVTRDVASSKPALLPARLAVAVAAVVVVAFLVGLLPRLRQRTALAVETREMAVPNVTVVLPAPGKAAGGLPLPAEIKSWAEAGIFARANGYVKRWLVDIGANVSEGQLLAEIETPELDQELDHVRHRLAEDEAALTLARITADRYANLVKTASVSEQENAEKQADLQLKSASVAGARSEVGRLESLKGFARVTAPFAGTITVRNTDVGKLVAPGSKELFRLEQTDKLRVYVPVPQSEALSVAPGQAAELTIAEMPGRVFASTVARTAGAIAGDSRTLLVELEVDNKGHTILAGSFGQVRLTGAKAESRLTLPANALLFRAEGPQVAVVQPDGQVQLRSVTLGRDFGQRLEMLAGVSATDQVILNPSDSLADGASVHVAEVAKSEMPKAGKKKAAVSENTGG